jgi:hypothetical protein
VSGKFSELNAHLSRYRCTCGTPYLSLAIRTLIHDDFCRLSSYVWTVHLRFKEVAKALPAWERAVENVSEHRLKTLVVKDGPIYQVSD